MTEFNYEIPDKRFHQEFLEHFAGRMTYRHPIIINPHQKNDAGLMIRAYIHQYGIEEYLEEEQDQTMPIPKAQEHFLKTIKDNYELIKNYQFIIATLWGEKGNKMMDMLGMKLQVAGFNQSNPQITAWVTKNGVYQPENNTITCEDTIIAFGAEAKHRRKHRYIDDFMYGNGPRFKTIFPNK